jgi:predicted N-acyltransferase
VHFSVHEGAAIDARLWDFFHHCYTLTYHAHHSQPYLRRDFFTRMASTMPATWVLFVAHLGTTPIACSLIAVDREHRAAWGRYWGSTQTLSCLHFEACYYQPLQWCIAQGFTRFEGGAQGEHKMARGFLAEQTCSLHWLAEPAFADAVDRFLEREGQAIDGYMDELTERSPFRAQAQPAAPAASAGSTA